MKVGDLFVRTPLASSTKVTTSQHLAVLIELATQNRADRFLGHFEAMLKGRLPIAGVSADHLAQQQIQAVEGDLIEQLGDLASHGRWRAALYPVAFREDRWEDDQLREFYRRSMVNLSWSTFPTPAEDLKGHEWGIFNFYRNAWGLTRSGIFLCLKPFVEEEHGTPERFPHLKATEWLDYRTSLAQIVYTFMFTERLAHFYDPGERVVYEFAASPIKGRQLVSINSGIDLDSVKANANQFVRRKSLSVEELIIGWRQECVTVIHSFVRLFNESVHKSTIEGWVTNLEHGR